MTNLMPKMRLMLWFNILLLFCVCNPLPTYGNDSEHVAVIIATGSGTSLEMAKEDAIRNAITKVIGIYVSSDTIVSNNQLIKDKILSYSGGYLKYMRVISQGNNNNLFTVEIEALVVDKKVKQKLEEINIATKNVEGESLFGESISKINEQISAINMMNRTILKYPQAAYEFTIYKTKLYSVNPLSKYAKLEIPLLIKWDKDFIEEFRTIASMVSSDEENMASLSKIEHRWSGKKVWCFSGKDVVRSGKAETCNVIVDGIEDPFGRTELYLLLTFKDKAGTGLFVKEFKVYDRLLDSAKKQGIKTNGSSKSLWGSSTPAFDYAVQTQLDGRSNNLPNMLTTDFGKHKLFLIDGEFSINIKLDVDVSVLSNVASIDVLAQ